MFEKSVEIAELRADLEELRTKHNRLKETVEEYRNACEVYLLCICDGNAKCHNNLKYRMAIFRSNLFAALDET